MPAHKLSQYRDGWIWVDFCIVCSGEGENLFESCPGRFIVDKEKEENIDTDKELA